MMTPFTMLGIILLVAPVALLSGTVLYLIDPTFLVIGVSVFFSLIGFAVGAGIVNVIITTFNLASTESAVVSIAVLSGSVGWVLFCLFLVGSIPIVIAEWYGTPKVS